MLTKNEITALNLSPTKKDFVQIWNELLEVAGKLSERWDPTSTNESDPGIVILKALTGIADKLNYNIDKNTLEAFMPTAAQEDSMRKLCDMLGYTMKYYRSAETEVIVKYYNPDPSDSEAAVMADVNGLYIPKFTVLTDSDQTINYFTTNEKPVYIKANSATTDPIPCMEGQIVKCDSNANGVITISHISENNRFYFAETQIAENGIFIYNVNNDVIDSTKPIDGTKWTKVDNLNVQVRGDRVFKFGYDSYEGRPYVEFPEDFSELFNDGIFIYYTRTSGINGNISPKTLTQIELPSGSGWSEVAAESFSVENTFSATSGANAETIKQAYSNFKKTIGTFETLVTCRDYMNKIYSLMNNGKPFVSNILVTDIRNDLNRAVTICSCDDAGIFYKETPILTGTKIIEQDVADSKVEHSETISTPVIEETVSEPDRVVISEVSTLNKPVFSNEGVTITYGDVTRSTNWFFGSTTTMPLFADSFADSFIHDESFDSKADGIVSSIDANGNQSDVWLITQSDKTFRTILPIEIVESYTDTITKTLKNTITKTIIDKTETSTATKLIEEEHAIDHFDLVFYPFKSYNQIKNNLKNSAKDICAIYDASFALLSEKDVTTLTTALNDEGIKTISHTIKAPKKGDLISINNYLRLSAVVVTNAKVTEIERELIINNIKIALANAFNMRELDFGDEIPFDSIVDVIENADPRIRVVSLKEPALYTTFSVLEEESNTNKLPKVVEYAVASDWLDADMAEATGRLTKTEEYIDNGNNKITRAVSTFNTKEAKQIYNKLVVRNVLAGRVPLFSYNNTFKTNFSESAYQVTTKLQAKPRNLEEPTEANPFTILVEDDIIYTGQLIHNENAGSMDGYEQPPYIIIYTATKTPEEYEDIIVDNVIKETVDAEENIDGDTASPGTNGDPSDTDDTSDNNTVVTDYITDISTSCKIFADEYDVINEVTLGEGEFVKFRAPNLVTTKTYPAYVNYHLELNKDHTVEASPAVAASLFTLISKDVGYWTSKNTNVNWQKVLDYFKEVDKKNNTSYVKTFTVRQEALATKITDTTSVDIQQGDIEISMGSSSNSTDTQGYTVESLIAMSGCVKLSNTITNGGFKANVYWAEANDNTPGIDKLPVLTVPLTHPFITDLDIITKIKNDLDNTLTTYKANLFNDADKEACLGHKFIVELTFECVPFEARSLAAWEKFVSDCAKHCSSSSKYKYQIFDVKPISENDTFLWRMTSESGHRYDIGKYVTDNNTKLIKFDKNYFGQLGSRYLEGIYIVSDIGVSAEPALIKNNVEYELQDKERLYIEYTSSSTTEDSSSKNIVTEVHGKGTVIRPSGFESGLMDSTAYKNLGNTPLKSVVFAQVSNTPVELFSLGASAKLEVREKAEVKLTKDSFSNGSGIYIYKNFNNCPELEEVVTNVNGKRINNTYTLKDGEYIFYTDQNKSDFAYYTSGTQVTLTGSDNTLPEFDVIELSTIFDSSIQEIPWKQKLLEAGDSIVFQEFQYTTLGPGDTIKSMSLLGNVTDNETAHGYLDENWRYCADVKYTTSGTPDSSMTLAPIKTQGRLGDGWEACSTLELDVTSNSAQTLRSTDKVETGIVLHRTSTVGGDAGSTIITPKNSTVLSDYSTSIPLSFKTNIACQACGNSINIDEVYGNTSNTKGFQLKVFTQTPPVIVKTRPGTVIPYVKSGLVDMVTWTGEPLATKDNQELWNHVAIDRIKATDAPSNSDASDNALRLSVSVLQDTYGIFCVYLDNTNLSANDTDTKIWIEVMPGVESNVVSLLNAPDGYDAALDDTNKLYLHNGINCIRVAKTCKIFIKASSNAAGVLYFDEPRLVNRQKLKYIDSSKNPIELFTNGLNLTQLGYLDASGQDSTKLDKSTYNKLFNLYAENASTSVNDIIHKVDDDITDTCTKLKDLLPKIQTLITAEELIKKDIQSISGMETDRLNALVDIYTERLEILNTEKALLEALDKNTEANELEQKLVALLSSFSDVKKYQQQITEELSNIKDNITVLTTNMSDTMLMEDYEELIKTGDTGVKADLEAAFTSIKNVAIDTVENNYQEQLAALVDSLDQVMNSSTRSSLLTILDNLRAVELSDTKAELLMYVNRLVEAVDLYSVTTTIAEMSAAAAAEIPNYSGLYLLAMSLSNLIDYRGLAAVVSDISQAALDTDSTVLKALLEELAALIESINPDKNKQETGGTAANGSGSSETESLSTQIEELIKAVQKKLGDKDETVDSGIQDKIKSIDETFRTDFCTKLEGIMSNISTCIGIINNEDDTKKSYIVDLISTLENLERAGDASSNGPVTLIVDKINDIIAERTTYIDKLSAATYDTWLNNSATTSVKSFLTTATLALWPTIIKNRVTNLLNAVDYAFYLAIDSALDKFDDNKTSLTKLLSKETNPILTSVILDLIDTSAISTLFEKVKTLLSIREQNESTKQSIASISALVQNSAELSCALNNSYENEVIKTIVEDLNSTNDVVQKQMLQATLKEELTKVVVVDEQLFSVIASLLCPNIDKVETVIDKNDSFYSELIELVYTIKSLLVGGKELDVLIPCDKSYSLLLGAATADFESMLRDFTKPESSLLPNEVITKVDSIKVNFDDIENDIDQIQTHQIFITPTVEALESVINNIKNNNIKEALQKLKENIEQLETTDTVEPAYEGVLQILRLEEQLLADIRKIDVNRAFYYSVPVEDRLAIELNESDKKLNTLMNPAVNYDINNVNNSFVISKLDINYLDSGIQIARSSRLN